MNTINLMKSHKRLYAAAGAVELATAGMPKKEKLLIKLRASFENACRFCIEMHSTEALEQGFGHNWIDAIESWPESGKLFSEEDNLILAFTTAGTRLSDREFDLKLQGKVIEIFGEKKTGDLIAAITAINMWNRIGVLSQK